MSNFEYLSSKSEYSLFSSAAIEAEKVFSTSPAMCAVGCRKALELAVKWVYAADKTITMPYKDNLQSLLHEPSFRFAVDRNVWSVLPSIVKAGNLAVHTGHSVSAADAVFSLRGLFDFIQWVDYCYGTDYVERSFDETAIPGEKVTLDEKDPGAGKFTVPERCRAGSLAQAGGKPFGGIHSQQTAEPAEPQFHRRRPYRGRDAAEDHRHRPQGHGLEIHRVGCRCAHRVRSGQHERRAGAEGLCGLCADGQRRLAAGSH